MTASIMCHYSYSKPPETRSGLGEKTFSRSSMFIMIIIGSIDLRVIEKLAALQISAAIL